MNNDVKIHRTPSEILSEIITNTLLEKQLLLSSDIQKVQKKPIVWQVKSRRLEIVN